MRSERDVCEISRAPHHEHVLTAGERASRGCLERPAVTLGRCIATVERPVTRSVVRGNETPSGYVNERTLVSFVLTTVPIVEGKFIIIFIIIRTRSMAQCVFRSLVRQ